MAQTIKLKRSSTGGAVPSTSSLSLGEVAINTYDGKMYIKKNDGSDAIVEIGAGTSAVWKSYDYTATSSQTSFSGNDNNSDSLSYVAGFVQVFLNGILLDPAVDYAATTGSSIVLTSGASTGDLLQIETFSKIIGTGDILVDTFPVSSTQTAFTLSQDPVNKSNISVYVEGVYQESSTYSLSGTTLTLSESPANGTTVEVVIGTRNVTLDGIVDLTISGTLHAGALDLGDANIINVNEISLDTIKGDADANTNITFAGSDVTTFTQGGQERLRLNTTGAQVTGNIVVSGNVDGRDVAADGVTADAALPRTGGAMGGAITTNSTFDGRDVSVDGTKLDTIEVSATADQTDVEIRAAVESASDSNVFTNADHSKLDGIEASATADQTQAEINALGITALTVTQAAQTAITSVGTLTALTVNSGDVILSGSSDLKINSGGTFRLYNSAGNGWAQIAYDQTNDGIQIQRKLVPSSNNSVDLGTSSLAFKDLFIAGTITGNLTGNVTGNTSGTALTVTQAAQTAITSVGTLTSLAVSGAVGAGAGTEGLPSLSFAGDTNTGIYSLAADNLGFSIGGTRKGFWSGTQFNVTGNGIFSGNGTFGGTLGVTGTISSGAITSSGNIAITAGSGQRYIEMGSGTSGAKTYRIYNGIAWNPDALLIYNHTDDSTVLTIEPGKLGINKGASSLSHTLDVGGNVAISGTEIISSARNLTNIGTISSGAISATGSANSGSASHLPAFLASGNYGGGIATRDTKESGWYQQTNGADWHFYHNRTVASDTPASKIVLSFNSSGNATFAGTLSSGAITSSGHIITNTSSRIENQRISMEADGTLDWGSSKQYGTLTWDTNKAIVVAQGGSSLEFRTNNTGVALQIDTSQNSTFLGEVSTTNAKLKAIAESNSDTAVDVFVYDTRKDSDGGAWRKRTQNTSWYNEALNTSTRGARKEFPCVAVIVLESNETTIYDGDDPDMPMWMKFVNAGGNSGIMVGELSNKCVTMLNGNLGVGSAPYDFYLVNFIKDKGYQYSNNVLISGTYKGDISTRNVTTMGWIFGTVPNIINRTINDVAMTVLPNAPIDAATGLPVPTIAVATNGGVSVIKDNGTVVDIINSTDSGYQVVPTIAFIGKSELIFGMDVGNGSRILRVHDIPTSDVNVAANWYNRGTSKRIYKGDDIGATPDLYTLDINQSAPEKNVLDGVFGGHKGLSLLDENTTTPTKGSVAYITSDYNTGWMNGDIKLATLSDTEAADNTEYVGGYGNFTDASAWTAGTGWSLSGNVATKTASTGANYISRASSGTFVSGEWYQAEFDLLSGNGTHVQLVNRHTNGVLKPYTNATNVDVAFFAVGSKCYAIWQQNTNNTNIVSLYASQAVSLDNFKIYKLNAHDRSVNSKPLIRVGTVTKTAVATGADLVGYSGFTTSNYLLQPYNAALNFTNEFSISFWVKNWSAGQDLLHRGPGQTRNSKTSFHMYCDGGYDYRLTLTSNGSSEQTFEIPLSGNLTGWQNVCFTLTPGGAVRGYLNGRLEFTGAFTGTNIFTQATDQNGLYIGDGPVSAALGGSLALLRLSATAPTPEQIAKMYNDEKHLFQTNAKATLYGTSDAVTALAYDDDTELLHVGTSAGRSEFQGLNRVNNTTDAVGTAISASNGFIVEE